MKKNIVKSRRYRKLFPYLLLLTGAFFIWQIVFSAVHNIDGCAVLNTFWSKLLFFPLNILPANLFFWFAQISLYFFFASFVWGIARLAGQFINLSWKNTKRLGFFLWGLGVAAILLANEIFYPESLFAELIHKLLSYAAAEVMLIIIAVILAAAVFLSILRIGQIFWRSSISTKICSAAGLIILGVFIFFVMQKSDKIKQMQRSASPNIIIIGLDALRPDRVGYYGSTNKTPNLDRFLSNSTNFMLSITPLARTFPAWSAILTGQYPKHSSIRFNSIDQKNLKLSNTLSAILRRNGYQTMYATDDRLFGAISKRFGFDEVLNEKQDEIDNYILSSVSDFPLSNLLVNTRIGEFLFPYNFGNRDSEATYDPSSFIISLRQFLNKLNPNRPLFLSVHFCLTHWPYTWGALRKRPNVSNSTLYNMAIEKIDKQFGSFLKELRKRHILNNAVVVVISDHGDAFDLSGDRLISRKNYIAGKFSDKNIFEKMSAMKNKNQALDVSVGHGTDALSFSQYRTILAFHYFGAKKNAKRFVNNMVSLIDIKPTVLSMLNLSSPDTDGKSLLPYINGKNVINSPRKVFIETGFTPKAIETKEISVKNTIHESIGFFHIDVSDDQLIMDSNAVKKLINAKQRAVYYGDWLLALYPMKNNRLIPILVNRKTRKWTDDMHTKFAEHSPAQKLLKKLKVFYGKEISV